MFVLIAYAFILVTFILTCSKQPKPVNGVYCRPGPFYYLKYISFILLLQLSRLRKKKPRDGKNGFSNESEMDMPQPFSEHKEAFDAVFFSGANMEGKYFVIAAQRKPNSIINGVMYVKVPGVGLYRGTWLPKTRINADSDNEFKGQGIHIKPLEPMRRWKLHFKGKLKRVLGPHEDDDNDVVDVTLDGFWSSNETIFNYDTDMSPHAAARTFAKQQWNKQYFDDLERAHQTHYEQMGFFDGTLDIDGTGHYTMKMASFRDHSFGTKRDWKLMHRYVFHHIFLANGWKAVVGVVCQPHTCTSLECGFVSLANGNLDAIESCSLKLEHYGEGGKPPLDYAFSIESGGKEYFIQVDITAEGSHFYGDENESKIYERFASYTMNGIPGSGIIEWQYRFN